MWNMIRYPSDQLMIVVCYLKTLGVVNVSPARESLNLSRNRSDKRMDYMLVYYNLHLHLQ